MKKLAIVVGHNSHSPGAVRSDTGESEFSYNSRLAGYMQQYGGPDIEVRVFFREFVGSYTREIRKVYSEVDNWGADASIELHFNSAGTPDASGTETLTSGSAKSVTLAQEVQMHIVELLGLRDRGIQVRNSRTKGRGYMSLVSGNAPAILIEPFFGSSPKGQVKTDEEHEQRALAEAVMDGVREYFAHF